MKILRLCAVISAIAVFAACTPPGGIKAYAAAKESPTAVVYNGLLQQLNDTIVTENGALYISIGDLAQTLGGTAAWDAKTKTAALKAAGIYAKVKANSAVMEINYTKVTSPYPAIAHGGHIYVPALFFLRGIRAEADYDTAAGVIRINDGKAHYSVYDTKKAAYSASLLADKKNPAKELTVNDAVNMIVVKNAALNDAKAGKPLLERRKKDIDDAVDKMIPTEMDYTDYYELYFIHSGGTKTVFTQSEVDLLRSQQKVNNQIESISLTEKTIRESAKTQVVSLYIDIDKAFADIYMAEERLAYDERQLAAAKLKTEIGYEGQSAVVTLESTVSKDKLTLEQLRLKLETAKNALCDALGFAAGTVITLTDYKTSDVKYNADYEAYSNERIKASPAVALKTLDFKYAQYEESSYNLLLSEDEKPYRKNDQEKRDIEIQNENAVSSAKAALSEAKDAVLTAARSRSQNISSLKQNGDTLALDYESAKRSYDTALTNYLAGNISLNDVNAAKLQLFSAEASLYQNSLNLRAAVEAYRNIF